MRLPYGGRRLPRRFALIGVAGVLAGVGALGSGSASFAAAKPHHPSKPHPPKQKPNRVNCSAGGAGLVAAINAANSSGGGAIELDNHCPYMLTAANNSGPTGANGLPQVTSQIVVKGNHAPIAGNNSNFRIFEVDGPNGNLTLDHLTLTGGHAVQGAGPGPSGAGGALFNNEATVTITHSTVTGNTGEGGGGGIASGTGNNGPIGSLTIDHSLISNNTAGGGGGGILNHAGTLTVKHSRTTGNTGPGGGGIATGPGNITGTGSVTLVDHSKIHHNTANGGEEGGGAGIANGGVLTIKHSELRDNDAPGAAGGGLLNHGSSATLDHSKVKGNTAAIGAGIANLRFGPEAPVPQLTLTHTEVTHNVASVDGGGIFNDGGSVTLHKSKVKKNTPDNCAPPGSVPGCTG